MQKIEMTEMPKLAAEALEILTTRNPPKPGSLIHNRIVAMHAEAPSVPAQKLVATLLEEIVEYALAQVATQHWMEQSQ